MLDNEIIKIKVLTDDIYNVHNKALKEAAKEVNVSGTYYWAMLLESIRQNGFSPMATGAPFKSSKVIDAYSPQPYVLTKKDNKYKTNTIHRSAAARILGLKKIEAFVRNKHPITHTKQEYKNFISSLPKGNDHYVKVVLSHGEIRGRDDWEADLFDRAFSLTPRILIGKRVLDAGCNTGGLSFYLLQLGAEVVGIDNLERAIVTANKIADFEFGYRRKDIRFILGSIYDVDKMGLGKFQACFVNQSIYHVRPDGKEALKKICNLCEEALWMFTNISSIPTKQKKEFPRQFIPTLTELKDFLKENNFKKLIIPKNKQNMSVLSGLGYNIFSKAKPTKEKGSCNKVGFIATKKEYFEEYLGDKAYFISDLVTGKENVGNKNCVKWYKKEEYENELKKRKAEWGE